MAQVVAAADHHFHAAGPRADECVRVHENIVEIVKRERPSVFVSAGDVYERASTPQDREQAAAFFAAIADICPVVVVQGNHDRPLDVAFLRRIKARYPIHAVEGAQNVIIGDVAVMAVGWPSRAMLRTVCGEGVDVDTAAREALGGVLSGLAAELDLAAFEGARVLAMHAMVDGSVTSVGQPLVGCEFNVDLATLAMARCHVGILGHIHAPQQWTFGGVTYAYTGSPYRTAFGETEDKGVIAWSPGEDIRRVDTGARRMVLMETEYHGAHVGLPGDVVAEAGFTQDFYDAIIRDGACWRDAEVRLRYHVSEHDRAEARAHAEEMAQTLRDEGAASVKVDPQVHHVERQREGAASLAGLTLGEKVARYWEAKDIALEDAERIRAATALGELEQLHPAADRSGAVLRLERLRCSGLGPFSEIDLDVASLPGPLVAVTGANGSGKSTLLELLPAALYRTAPTRGKIAGLAYARAAQVEATFSLGDRTFAVRQMVDPIAGKGESLVLRADAPGDVRRFDAVLPDTKVTSFGRWADAHLPPPELFYSTTFRSQRDRGVAQLKAGERKAVLLRAMGLERLEAMAETARKRQRDAASQVATAEARLADETARGGDMAAATAALAAAMAELVAAQDVARESAQVCAAAASFAESARAEHERLAAAEREHERLTVELTAIDTEIAGVVERIANNSALLVEAEQIRAEADADRARVEKAQANREEYARLTVLFESSAMVRNAATAEIWDVERRLAEREELDRRKAREEEALYDAKERGSSAEYAVDTAEAALKAANDRAEAARDKVADQIGVALDDRLAALRGGAREALELRRWARLEEALAADDAAFLACSVSDTVEAEERAAREAQRAASAVLEVSRARYSVASVAVADACARLDTTTALIAAMGDLDADLEEASAAHRKAVAETERLFALREGIGPTEAKPDERIARRLTLLEAAEGRIADLRAQEAALLARRKATAAAIAELPRGNVTTAASARKHSEEAYQQANGEHHAAANRVHTAQLALSMAEKDLDRARESAARAEALRAERSSADAQRATWSLLASSLGRDGLQAMEADSAAADMTATANALLETCVGSRWRVRVETQRESADGKRQLEGLSVDVLDTSPTTPLGEQWRSIETLSGGEEVIVSEALSLALTVYATQATGASAPTLIRDESGAALDGQRAVDHVTMLRRAADMIGADKVLLITHTPAAWEICDSRVDLRDGKAVVL